MIFDLVLCIQLKMAFYIVNVHTFKFENKPHNGDRESNTGPLEHMTFGLVFQRLCVLLPSWLGMFFNLPSVDINSK